MRNRITCCWSSVCLDIFVLRGNRHLISSTSGDVNGTMGDVVEPLHLRKKEDNSPQQENSKLLDSSTMFMSVQNEWRDPLSSIRSPELFSETLEGKIFVESGGPNTVHESPCAVNHGAITLKGLKDPNSKTVECSTNREEISMRRGQGQWHHLFQLAGGSGNVSSRRDLLSMESGMINDEETAKLMLTPKYLERPISSKNLNEEHVEMPRHLINNSNTITTNSLGFPRGICTKVLPSSGFPQFFVKNSLKGKGALYVHPEIHQKSRDVSKLVMKSENTEKEIPGIGLTLDAPRGSSTKLNNMSLRGGGNIFGTDTSFDGVNLREFLKFGSQKINKVDGLNIFMQIVELVDLAYSQGVPIQDIRPSSFLIFPSNQLKYIGLWGTQTKAGLSETHQDAQVLEWQLKRKRCLEQDTQTSSMKHQKTPKQMKFVGQYSHYLGTNSLRNEVVREDDTISSKAHYFGYDLKDNSRLERNVKTQNVFTGHNSSNLSQSLQMDLLLEERWYASPEELSDGVCMLSSNIYSLGVFLFELLCTFESSYLHTTAMSDLRHRILPPTFLSENPKEADFCLWLLHPEPSSRPRASEILQSELISEARESSFGDKSSLSEDEDIEADLLLHFLLSLKEQKQKQASKVVEGLGCINFDIEEVERQHSLRIGCASGTTRDSNDISNRCHKKDTPCSSQMHVAEDNEARLMRNIAQLEQAYFSMRSKVGLPEANVEVDANKDVRRNQDMLLLAKNTHKGVTTSNQPTDRLGAFFEGICKFARYSKFEVKGTLRNGDLLNSSNVICSLSFDRDEDYFAAAGVSKKIKIFEFGPLLNDMVDIHYPVVEMSSKSKLSCVCWNNYIKNYLASTDYDGVVQLWDASTVQGFMRFTEHHKRAWSVDFSPLNPMKLASGSDDCSVKLWSINEENCICTIGNVANICCVQFSSHSTHLLAFGSADNKIYCYDLRNTRNPWCTLLGHGKAVSYVRFLDSNALVSSSTDNTLKLWDLNNTTNELSNNACSLTLSGHTNEKNFVGLSVSDGYITCGSETNEVYAYYRSLPMPMTSHKFGSIDPISGQETGDDNGQFVSSVCWRGKSNMVVVANSSGSIKLLQLV
ncbi:protein SUPPRESSOR OF PHYA-105 1-like [Aristolochia californica]|uniref:protein SUPPRESSOR OF PHYA-105 1-like n=1 Tax=Aristolochia californica TaxID=171875 RepID=UPI0035DF8130